MLRKARIPEMRPNFALHSDWSAVNFWCHNQVLLEDPYAWSAALDVRAVIVADTIQIGTMLNVHQTGT